jgi:hydrogenase maturation protease
MTAASRRILVAGIGNIFLGDDAFGVEVARLLLARPQPRGVRVVDFGIRGLDLAYALTDGCDAAVLVDAAPRGQRPGTLYLIEPELDSAAGPSVGFDGHSMNPVAVLRLASTLGELPRQVFVVGCEPTPNALEEDADFQLSGPVLAALGPAVDMVESLIERFINNVAARVMRDTAVAIEAKEIVS